MADVENDKSIVLVGADDEPEVAVDNNNDVGDDGDVAVAVAGPIQRKRGRATSEIWSYFTKEKSPSQLKSAIFQHCQMRVNYHKKSESVVVHLNRCAPFKALMNGMAISDRPEWYQGPKKRGAPSAITKAARHVSSNSGGSLASIRSFALPKVDVATKKRFQKAIAYHYFNTGSSFQRIEDSSLIEAIKILRPDEGLLPDRKTLANSLLDICYTEVKKKCDDLLSTSASQICLVTDGWSNIRNEPIVNYMATCPAQCFFLESVSTGEQGHTAEWIAEDIERVIKKNNKTDVAGVVTDSTSANKKAWNLLKAKFPGKFFQGCASHGLHLMVKDILYPSKRKKANEPVATFPIGYPFSDLFTFTDNCKEVVKFFHNHHAVKAKLKEAQQHAKVSMLVKPAPTRWGSMLKCFESLLKSEKSFFRLSPSVILFLLQALQRRKWSASESKTSSPMSSSRIIRSSVHISLHL
jgi:Protein of unknown function (DUF 659)